MPIKQPQKKSGEGKKKNLLSFLLPGAILLIFAGVWIYLYLTVNSEMTMIVQNKIKSAQIAQQVSHLVDLKSQSQQAEAMKPQLERMLPDKGDILLIPSDIKAIGQTYGMNINFTFGQENAASHYIDFSLSTQGSAAEFFDFLRQTEKLPYFFDLETVNATDLGGGNLQINSVGRIFLK